MKSDISVKGNRISLKPKTEDAGARVYGVAQKLATNKKLTDDERDLLLVAIAQKLGVPV